MINTINWQELAAFASVVTLIGGLFMRALNSKFAGLKTDILELKSDLKEVKADVRLIENKLNRLESAFEERGRYELYLHKGREEK